MVTVEVTLHNPDYGVITLTAGLTDNLPNSLGHLRTLSWTILRVSVIGVK